MIQKKHWVQGTLLLFCSVLLVTVFTAGNGLVNWDTAPEAEKVRWPELLQSYRRLLQSLEQTARQLQQRVEHAVSALNDELSAVEQQAAAYQFMLNSYGLADAFEIMLRCRQAADLKAAFGVTTTALQQSLLDVDQLIAQIDTMRVGLENELLLRSGTLRPEMERNIAEGETLKNDLTRLVQPLRALMPRVTEVEDKVNALYERSQKERVLVLDQIFFQRGRNYMAALHMIPGYLPQWSVKVAGWLEAQVPAGWQFWVRLGLLFGGMLIPVGWAVRRFIEPLLYRYGVLIRAPGRSACFLLAWGITVLSFAFYIARIWANESENGVLAQMAESLGAIAMLFFALILRERRGELGAAVRLYLPVMVQHLCGMVLYMALAPYLPLVLLVPPLNLLVTVWILGCMGRYRYDWLELTFGTLSVAVALISGYLAAVGLPYLGFTMTLGWLVLVAQFQLVIAITDAILSFVRKNAQRLLINTALLRLVLPLGWIWALLRLVGWATGTYHLEDYLQEVMAFPFPLPEIVHINLNRVVTALLVAFALQFIIKFIKCWIRVRFGEVADSGLAASMATLGTYLSWTLFALFVMFLCEVDTQSVMVMIGGLCVGLGFALKSGAENFISGVALLVGQEVRPGDVIEVDASTGLMGRVRKVNFRVTTVETEDGAIITYPNAQVMAQEFRNWTRNNPYRRFDIPIDVPYNANLGLVQKLLLEAARAVDGIQKHPAPMVYLNSFEDSSIRFHVRVWMVGVRYREITSGLRLRVIALLGEHQIEIPFPQLDVHQIPPPATGSGAEGDFTAR